MKKVLIVWLAAAVVACGSRPVVPAAATGPRPPSDPVLAERVRQELLHAWKGYKTYAWGHDDLLPVSKTWRDWYGKEPLLMTAVDTLSTLAVMGFHDEVKATTDYVATSLSFDKDINVSNFEITIRILGGLLSAHQTTGDVRLLAMADDLAKRLLPAFKSRTGMPYRFVNLRTGRVDGVVSNPAEIGTLILEWGTLSKLTKNPVYFDTAKRALVALYNHRDPTTGLVGQGINVETGEWTNKASHIGGAIDSYYEYLLKCERLFGDRDCGDMYRASIGPVHRFIADEASGGLWYGRADMSTGARTGTTFGSLHAFFPGVLAMGGDLDRARRLQDSAFRMWTLHGIEPEALDYRTMTVTRASYQLRPEIIESAYILAHYTKDAKYLDMGRTMFRDLVAHCRTDAGYTVLQSVVTKEKGDLQHSFLLAETLKYLYLLFAPDALDFDHVTFNTEAHPLRATRAGASR
ncbi:MAG TPA: glycoside hydrolase family 47 protein [Vicinamibacterales bacterium]|nr:glycoside hydrolase family 47 protein [Vicinamibacterales bacterium]